MSYILNALRKSERERQTIDPDTLTSRIVINQPPRQQGPTKLIAALIAINLAILVYFVGFAQKAPPAVSEPAVPPVRPEQISDAEIVSPDSPETKQPVPKKPVVAEIVEAGAETSAVPPKPKTAPAKKPPADSAKAAAVLPSPAVRAAEIVLPPVKKQLVKRELVPSPVIPEIEPAKAVVEKTAPPVKDDLPFLDELPGDFRRSLPNLPINVFSYSSAPSERFVMIDMVKYVPGQSIKDLLQLKEIRPDSIVVSYEDRVFKIRRP